MFQNNKYTDFGYPNNTETGLNTTETGGKHYLYRPEYLKRTLFIYNVSTPHETKLKNFYFSPAKWKMVGERSMNLSKILLKLHSIRL